LGGGNWKGCNGNPGIHQANIRFKNSPPSRWADRWDEIWDIFVRSYAEMGLLWVRNDDDRDSEATFEFVTRSNGWIGLAIVGRGARCGSGIWAKYLSTYQPRNVVNEVSTLLRHEAGHLVGMGHSRGGVMNPSIVNGLPPTFRGDPVERQLVSMFGGESVPIPGDTPQSRKLVMAYEYENGKLEKLYDLPQSDSPWPN
jgi:hypothetical protein